MRSTILKWLFAVAGACVALGTIGCSSQKNRDPESVVWTPLQADNVLSNLSTAIWTPVTEIKRGDIIFLSVMVKNHSGHEVTIPKDVFGRLGLQAKVDGVWQPASAFDYRCDSHTHNWTMTPGDVLMRPIPVFTGIGCERLKSFDNIHPLPMPIESVLAGVYGEEARRIVVRLGAMASTNLSALGCSEVRFTVTK
jgi:hypothetical protein